MVLLFQEDPVEIRTQRHDGETANRVAADSGTGSSVNVHRYILDFTGTHTLYSACGRVQNKKILDK